MTKYAFVCEWRNLTSLVKEGVKEMQSRWLFVSVVAVVCGWMGLFITFAIAQHESDMEMMKKMMMNRPKALKQADMAVQSEKKKLIKSGKYGCCLKHGCDQCVLKMGGCPCGMNAANDKPVCHECKGGWAAGDGAIPGKTADEIKVMPRMGMNMK